MVRFLSSGNNLSESLEIKLQELYKKDFFPTEKVYGIPTQQLQDVFSGNLSGTIDCNSCDDDSLFYLNKEQFEYLRNKLKFVGTPSEFPLYLFDSKLYIEKSKIKVFITIDNIVQTYLKSRNDNVKEFVEEIRDANHIDKSLTVCTANKKIAATYFSELLDNFDDEKIELICFDKNELQASEENRNGKFQLYGIVQTIENNNSQVDEESLLPGDKLKEDLNLSKSKSSEQSESEDEMDQDGVSVYVSNYNNLTKKFPVVISKTCNSDQAKSVMKKALGLQNDLGDLLLVGCYKNVFKVYKNCESLHQLVENQMFIIDVRNNGVFPIEHDKKFSCFNNDSSEFVVPLHERGVVGLYNLGNTCYFNAGIQCLSNSVLLRKFLTDEMSESDINESNPLSRNGDYARSISTLFKEMWKVDCPRAITPSCVREAIAKHAPQFAGYQQQDSQELISEVLDGLHEDLNRIKKKPYVEEKDYDGTIPLQQYADESWDKFKLRNDSIVTDLFSGMTQTVIDCSVCGCHKLKFETFSVLPVPLPAKHKIKQLIVKPKFDSNNPSNVPFYAISVRVPDPCSCGDLSAELARLGFQNVLMLRQNYYKEWVLVSPEDGIDSYYFSNCDYFAIETDPMQSDDSLLRIDFVKEVANKYTTSWSHSTSVSFCNDSSHIPIFVQVNLSKLTGKELYYKVVKELTITPKFRERINDCFVALEGGKIPCLEKDQESVQAELIHNDGKDLSNSPGCGPDCSLKGINKNEGLCCNNFEQTENINSSTSSDDLDISSQSSCERCSLENANNVIDASSLSPNQEQVVLVDDEESHSDKSIIRDAFDSCCSNEVKSHDNSKNVQNELSTSTFDDDYSLLCSRKVNAVVENDATDKQEDYDGMDENIELVSKRKDENVECNSGIVVPFVLVVSYESGSYWSPTKREVVIPFDDSIAIQPNGNEKFFVSLRWNKNEENEKEMICPIGTSFPVHPRSEHEEQANPNLTLGACLEKFSEPVTLDKSDMWYCPKCKENRCAQLRQQIWKCPRYLIIALKRFVYRGAYRAKNTEFVDYPEYLSVPNKEKGSTDYRFYAVSRHHGSLGGGHYTAIARQGERWVDFNDSSATVLPSRPESDPSAYVLFYEKVDLPPMIQ